MQQYLDLLQDIKDNGVVKKNRTGIDTLSVFGRMFEYDMSDGGFPLLTVKKLGVKSIFAELEMFIHGVHDKEFLHERGCHIWDEWCSPEKVLYGHDPETLQKMKEETELGPIYGAQWINWNGEGINQLRNVIEKIKTDPTDRRLIVTAWNPAQLDKMALPPCHYGYQFYSAGDGKLSLAWNQRSLDTFLGFGFDLASYAMLLTLVCKEVNMKPDKLKAFIGDCHIYMNQMDAVNELLTRKPKPSPTIEVTNTFDGWTINDWKCTDYILYDYDPHPALRTKIAV